MTSAKLVHDVLRQAADEHGDGIAIEDGEGKSRTFVELWERAQRLAAGLRASGLHPGDRVLEALPNGCELVECDMALSIAGLVRVPLNPRLGARAWAAIAADSDARALIVADDLTGADGEQPEDHVEVDLVVRTSGGNGLVYDDLAGDGRPSPPHAADPDDLVGLAYSSGTTGLPKGARRTHRMRVESARAMREHVALDAGPGSVYLHAGPAIHTSGLFVLPMLEVGARQLLVEHPRPLDIVEIVRRREVTHLALVPTVVAALAQLPGASREWFASVRMLAYAGAPMPQEQLRRAYDVLTPQLVQYYGLVEAMPPLSVLDVDDHRRAVSEDPRLGTSAGRMLPHVGARIVHPGRVDGTGELAVRGPVVTAAYWNAGTRSDLGKAWDEGWLLTGDVGRIEGGYLWLVDRRGDMIISGGYNIYPREVEEVVARVAGVLQCAVVGLPDALWGQRLVAAVTVTDAHRSDVAAQVDLACRALARHKRPKAVHVVDALPLGATGKIDRRAVARRLAD